MKCPACAGTGLIEVAVCDEQQRRTCLECRGRGTELVAVHETAVAPTTDTIWVPLTVPVFDANALLALSRGLKLEGQRSW